MKFINKKGKEITNVYFRFFKKKCIFEMWVFANFTLHKY